MSLWVKINLIIHFLFCMLLIGVEIAEQYNIHTTGDGFSFSLLTTIFSFGNLEGWFLILIVFLIGSIIWVVSWKIWVLFESKHEKIEHTSKSTFEYYAVKNLIVYGIWMFCMFMGLGMVLQ